MLNRYIFFFSLCALAPLCGVSRHMKFCKVIVDQYCKMSTQERQKILQKLPEDSMPRDDFYCQTIVEMGKKMVQKYDKSVKYCLGQSMSYPFSVACLIEMLSKKKQEKIYAIIPFSGAKFRCKDKKGDYKNLYYKQQFYESDEFKAYKTRVLFPLKLLPQDIIHRYKKHGQCTLLFERVSTGRSLGSFLALLFGFATFSNCDVSVLQSAKH